MTLRTHPNPEELGYDSTDRSTEAEAMLITAIVKGDIEEFEFRTLHVVREGNSLLVMGPSLHQQLGGRLLLREGQCVDHIHRWLTNKARQYGPAVEL